MNFQVPTNALTMNSFRSLSVLWLVLAIFACIPDTRADAKSCEAPRGWHLDRLDQEEGLDSCYTPNVKPRVKPVLYVIDSGVYDKHSEFSQNIVSHGYNFQERSWDSGDCSGHGSHVAALAAGKSFGVAGSIPVDIVSVRILDCKGRGSCSGMVKAMDWVYNNRKFLQPSTSPTTEARLRLMTEPLLTCLRRIYCDIYSFHPSSHC